MKSRDKPGKGRGKKKWKRKAPKHNKRKGNKRGMIKEREWAERHCRFRRERKQKKKKKT